MFGIFRKDETTIYDDPIARVLSEMDDYGPDSPEFPKMLAHLDALSKMKAEHRRKRISPDTMALIAGNLLGILIIVGYEHGHVMTSKAITFIKPKEPHI